ncbi:MAG TPA: phosphoglycerate mutase family protein [Gammaproteobacteria bacterium]|nr:phosphoglycerate mutase family protein [Gammaproteobacteria bacterium]
MASPTLPNPNDRRRRRRLRLIPIIGYTIVALAAGYFLGERQSTTVIFVRHADTDTAMAGPDDNPPLNERGRQRAELLADFLQKVDVTGSVNAIYASDKRRTQETAAPLAQRLNIRVEIDDHLDTKGFMDRMKRHHGGDIVLIVSHSNTIQPLIDELHGSKNLKPFAADEFNRLYVVTIPRPLGKVKTLEFTYPEPPVAPPVIGTPKPDTATSGNGGE